MLRLNSLVAKIPLLLGDFFLRGKKGFRSSVPQVSLEDSQAYAQVCGLIDNELSDAPDLATNLRNMLQPDHPIGELTMDECSRAINALYRILELEGCTSYQPKNLVKSLIAYISLKSGLLPPALILIDVEGVVDLENPANQNGGCGDVWEGLIQGESVAAKGLRCFRNHDSSLETQMEEFTHEVILWSGLEHDYIVPLRGIIEHPSRFMISPWMANGDIIGYLTRGELKENYVCESNRLLHQVARAIQYLHEEGIVHGDVRGQNVLIDGNGNARLTDFGVATLVGVRNIRKISARMGAIACRAPELIKKLSEPTFACDIYAFGMLCVEVYLSQSPYHDKRREHIIIEKGKGRIPGRPTTGPGGTMSEELWSLVKECLKKKPSQRPSAQMVVDRMKNIQT